MTSSEEEGTAPAAEGAERAAGGTALSALIPPPDAEGGVSIGSRAVSIVELAVFSSGTVASVSGLTVSTAGPAFFSLAAAVASPSEEAIRFPQPTTGRSKRKQSRVADTVRPMSHSGIAYLSRW